MEQNPTYAGQGTPTSPISPQDVPHRHDVPPELRPNEEGYRAREEQATPPPHYTQPERREHSRHRHRGAPILGPILLILAGVVFLLNNMGILPWEVWGQVWRLWPLLLIAIGFDLLVGRRAPVLSSFLVLLLLAGGVAFLLGSGSFHAPGQLTQAQLSVPLQGAKEAEVDLDFGAGKLDVGSLSREATELASGTLEYYENRGEPRQDVERDGDRVELSIKSRSDRMGLWGHKGASWDVKLNPQVPTALKVNAGASKVNLDLEQTQVTNLSLNTGASDVTIVFPSQVSSVEAEIDAGAAKVELIIPEGVAARITVSSAPATNVQVDDRFKKNGDVYETEGYDRAERKLTIDVDTGASSIRVTSK